jgi:HK97 family phage portal protein
MGLLDFLLNPVGRGWDRLPAPEQKALAIDDIRAAFTTQTMLTHGPGASDTGWRQGDGNSAVFACLMALSMAFIEPHLRVYKRKPDDTLDALLDHPIQALFDHPNPHLDMTELLWWLEWAKHCDGNAYLRKLRAGNDRTGNVVQLVPLSPSLCAPVTYRGSGDFISAYRYYYGPGKYEDIPVENIVHFRLGVDDQDMRLGLSPLKRLVRLISSDDEASKFANALLQNFAIPGLVILPAKGTEVTAEKALDLKQRISATFGSDNRGNVGVMSAGADVKQFGFSPHDLNLKELHQIPETRICAVMRVPPAVAGVSVGLEQTSNYASFREVREMFTEGTLLPEWRMDAAKLSASLVPDFTNDPAIRIAFDLGDVRALQQDVDAQYTRLTAAVQAGWVMPDEARAEVGLPPMPEQPVLPAQDQPALSVVKALAEYKRRGDVDGLPELYAAMIELARPSFESDLVDFMSAQRQRVIGKLVSGS